MHVLLIGSPDGEPVGLCEECNRAVREIANSRRSRVPLWPVEQNDDDGGCDRCESRFMTKEEFDLGYGLVDEEGES
jgi:DNA-directed RNA polymerase subunit RPC12/RpoP